MSQCLIIEFYGEYTHRYEQEDAGKHRSEGRSTEATRVSVAQDTNEPRTNQTHVVRVHAQTKRQITQPRNPERNAGDRDHDCSLLAPPELLVVHAGREREEGNKEEQCPIRQRL